MASIQEIKRQIQIANAIGIANLAEKEVVLDENATTIEIMQGIANAKGGALDGTDVKFGADATYDEQYAVLSESLNKIASLVMVMANEDEPMTIDEIAYWLGRVKYIPQVYISTTLGQTTFDATATAVLADAE